MFTRAREWNSPSTSRKPLACVYWVAHLAPKKRGSMEQQIAELAGRLERAGVRFGCVFASPPEPWLAGELARHHVEVRTLDFKGGLASTAKLAGWLGAARPDLVHFHFLRAHSPMVATARLTGASTVLVNDHVTLTRVPASPVRELWKVARARLIERFIDRRVAVSQVVAKSVADVEHFAPARVDVIENGIDVVRYGRGDGARVRAELGAGTRPIVACVSRLEWEKGVESAVGAVPLIGRDALLVLVGQGSLESRLRQMAEDAGVSERVRFLGLRDDVESILAASDVVIVPSHWDEAFGLAVVEGMAAGKPIVVSRSGAMPDIIGAGEGDAGEAGLVVPKRDPAALAGAITRLLDDPLLAARLGRAGRARAADRYGIARWADRTCALYARACPSLAPLARAEADS